METDAEEIFCENCFERQCNYGLWIVVAVVRLICDGPEDQIYRGHGNQLLRLPARNATGEEVQTDFFCLIHPMAQKILGLLPSSSWQY